MYSIHHRKQNKESWKVILQIYTGVAHVTIVTLSLKPTPCDQIAPDVRERSDACVLFGFFASAFILRSELSLTSGTEIIY